MTPKPTPAPPTSERRGCLLLALPRSLVSRVRPALPQTGALPSFAANLYDRVDLPLLVRVRRAAEGCLRTIAERRGDLAPLVVDGATAEVVALTSAIYRIGEKLGEARRFLAANEPDAIARERADLELQAVGASAHQLVALRQAESSLRRRVELVGQVSDQTARLSSRLAAATAEIEELGARLAVALGSEELGHELRAYQRSAELALEAFARTWEELNPRS